MLLALLALAAVGTVLLVAGAGTAAPGVAYEALVLLGSIAGVVVALVAGLLGERLVGRPWPWPRRRLVAMRDERLSTPDRLTDSTGVPVESAPEPEHVDLPRA